MSEDAVSKFQDLVHRYNEPDTPSLDTIKRSAEQFLKDIGPFGSESLVERFAMIDNMNADSKLHIPDEVYATLFDHWKNAAIACSPMEPLFNALAELSNPTNCPRRTDRRNWLLSYVANTLCTFAGEMFASSLQVLLGHSNVAIPDLASDHKVFLHQLTAAAKEAQSFETLLPLCVAFDQFADSSNLQLITKKEAPIVHASSVFKNNTLLQDPYQALCDSLDRLLCDGSCSSYNTVRAILLDTASDSCPEWVRNYVINIATEAIALHYHEAD